MSKIDTFRNTLIDGGHRSNRYRVVVDFPREVSSENITSAQKSFEFLAYDTTMPKQDLGEVKVNYKGRAVFFAGDLAEPDAWTCTVYNTTSFDIRNALLDWRNAYIQQDSVTGSNLIPLANATIEMLDKNDVVLQKGVLYNAWPNSIGEIKLTWDGNAGISNFQLTLRYDYIIEEKVSSGSNTTIEA